MKMLRTLHIAAMIAIGTTALLAATACSGKATPAPDKTDTRLQSRARAEFNADSALAYATAQVDFGPRIPGSQAHADCSRWIIERLQQFGADTVEVHGSEARVSDGRTFKANNILARFNSGAKHRIILLAHYDTRPWADHDPDPEMRRSPIDGANDGASGVAVLLETARQLGLNAPAVGVDFLFTDLEDYGTHAESPSDDEDTWAIGAAQFAAALPYNADNIPYMGILLDMVGGRDARFPMEYFSARYAQAPTAKVWAAAQRLGLADRFPKTIGGAITDDHLPLIRAGIPVTDIIESANPATSSFNPTWHTMADRIENLDPATMAAVGLTVLETIYNENP